ncbi:MAG: N-6 DNA methylase, partial [Planctomycetes bacterium]|nr:N-6 DNA methylase [Planctomycetota bacterium]
HLLMHYREHAAALNIRCLDSLSALANGLPSCDTNHLLNSIDAIATNPPWGSCKNEARNKNLVANIRSGESFSLFLEKSLRLLRDGGFLSFVLPESILKIKAHADIRQVLLEKTRIRKISLLGRVFSGVFTPIMRLDLQKIPAPPDWNVIVHRNGGSHACPQSRFAANAGQTFDVAVSPQDEDLLDKIYGVEHCILKHNAEWALGIVTGDNSRYVLDKPTESSEPVLRGRDVFKFAPRPPRCHIHFLPARFQQVAPERFFRAPEKLVYRFVSNHLVFAYDNHGLLTLNSANILIPRLPGISIKSTLAFLNSRVLQFVFTKRFRTRKILRGDLETLPFPVLSTATAAAIDSQVDRCMSGEYQPADELDAMIFKVFGFTDREIQALEESLELEANSIIL